MSYIVVKNSDIVNPKLGLFLKCFLKLDSVLDYRPVVVKTDLEWIEMLVNMLKVSISKLYYYYYYYYYSYYYHFYSYYYYEILFDFYIKSAST